MDAAAFCAIEGNSDMYGLGIRIGFYLQWCGAILGEWLAPDEVPAIRTTNSFFLYAVFLALVITRKELLAAEIYVVLLLFFGSALWILPVFVWRLVTGFDPGLDPTRHKKSKDRTRVAEVLWSSLLLAGAAFTLWFWAVQIPALDGQACPSYGFMFTRIQLDSLGFRVFHLVFTSLLALAIAALLIYASRDIYVAITSNQNNNDFQP
jgi:hypothetical protein